MTTNLWEPLIPYTAQDVREFLSAGIDGLAIQRIRFERDRQSLYTVDLFLYHRQLRRRMVWQFITLHLRGTGLHVEFPTPFRELPPAWNNLFAHAFHEAFSSLQAHPQSEQGFILTADFSVPEDVPPLHNGGENRVAPGFAWNELYIHSAKRYLFAAERVQGMRVLDLGCGVGYGAKLLARQAGLVVAADVDEYPLRYGEETYLDPKIQRVHIAPVTAQQGLPFEDEAFDAVVCFEVIEHIPVEQMEVFFAEIARVLKPEGVVILSTPNKHVYIHYPDPYHVSLMTLQEFRDLLGSRFREVQIHGQVRSRGLPHTTMEFDIVPQADDGQEIYVAVCRGYVGHERPISLPPPTVWEQTLPAAPIPTETAPSSEKLPVSVIVHTRNEEHNIAACLECVKGWAAEIIVMDMESTDRTVEIARQYTDKVYSHPLVRDFDIARNESAKYATQPWVLYVDADERVPLAFADALREILPSLDESVAGVCVAIKNYFLGRWIRHAGKWYPAYNAPRLLRKGRFQWLPAAHQGVRVHGRIKYMPADREEWAFEHFTTPSLNHYLGKLPRYSDSAAHRMLLEGAPCSWQTLAAAMGYAFRFYYDATHGDRDGIQGFLLAVVGSLSALIDQMKYAELLLEQGRLKEEEFLPPSGEAFFQLVTEVAAGRVPVEQKYLSQIMQIGEPAQEKPPSWWCLLWQRIQRQPEGTFLCKGDFPQTAGWRPSQQEPADALIAFGAGWREHVGRLREGGSFFIGVPAFPEEIGQWRAEIEEALQATAHLIDPESECPWLFAFGWKGERVEPVRRRVLMTTHQRALHLLGGGETQLLETLLALRQQQVVADLSVSLRLPEEDYDLIHAFSLYHADKIQHLEQNRKPLVVSTIFRDNSALYPVAVGVAIFRHQDPEQVQWLLEAWRGGTLQAQVADPQRLDEPEDLKSAKRRLVQRAEMLLPNCEWELKALKRYFRLGEKTARVVPNAVRPERFLRATPDAFVQRYGLRDFVLCAARIEPFKNQLMLLWALRGKDIPVVLAGKVSDAEYGELCQRWANERVHFVGELEPHLLASAYAAARVHAMPSWAETPGLTSLEAALAGCAIVVGDQGAEREYFGDFAHYCHPADVESVREAVLRAWEDHDAAKREAFREYILQHYTWEQTAHATAEAYERVLGGQKTFFCIPDWNAEETWQPIVRRYLEEYAPGDGVLLQLYAGLLNTFRAEDAFALLEEYVISLGVNPEACADIEIVDHLPENFLGRVWLTGGRYDSVAVARYGSRCERALDRAA